MTAHLMRINATPSVIDGLLTFQITGSPIPALIALALSVSKPILRRPAANPGE